ncbi:hypothetical protein [Brevibacillus massiliensis]|jgi:hypothetical protein|uniref:hypothetical protein n=1 Tax=Brevibacillus massiliensis TaxID=1118054 RepID=UPI0002ECD99D|nr:hypothetical protein [Brevibacillus massiliensis]
MNVIGIVQTDLNEFNILFEAERKHRRGQDDDHQQDDQDSGQDDGGDSSGIEDLFGLGGSGQNQNGGDGGQGAQEMTVRIKGVPEGQKATFLQMYQIIQDAKQITDLEKQLTIVSRGDNNNDQQQQGQDQKH